MAQERSPSSWFQRFLLPGFAFKAVVIGGGYATGRELAEFFVPSGPIGGVMAIVLAMVAWSAVCALTFLFAFATRSLDYRSFFRNLLGPFWMVFELAYLLFVVLILAVFGAAAGAIGAAVFGWPELIGTLALIIAIAAFTAFGNTSVERLFKWVTILSLRRVRSFRHPGPVQVWRSRDRQFHGAGADGRVVDWRVDVRRLQHHRRHRHPAGAAAPYEPQGCAGCRPAGGSARDLAGAALLRLHDRVLPGNRGRDAAIGLSAAAARSAALPRDLPAHDLLRAARERRRKRARLQ